MLTKKLGGWYIAHTCTNPNLSMHLTLASGESDSTRARDTVNSGRLAIWAFGQCPVGCWLVRFMSRDYSGRDSFGFVLVAVSETASICSDIEVSCDISGSKLALLVE